MRFIRFLPHFLLLATVCASPILAQQPLGEFTRSLGVVRKLTEPCTKGPGVLPRTTCTRLRVSVGGVPDIDVEVRVSDPAPGVRYRGTVLVGSGGPGLEFYGSLNGGTEVLQELQARGFRVVDRSWEGGWFAAPGPGARLLSKRYATLLSWVHDTVHQGGPFCVTGNSGGSAEIAYALTAWGCDRFIDVAVMSGGPPLSRIDHLCTFPQSAAWEAECAALTPPNIMASKPPCSAGPEGFPCKQLVRPTESVAQMRDGSILYPGAATNFPTTRVHLVLGAQDSSVAVPQAMLFFNRVTSEKIVEFVPNAVHWVPQTAEGRDAIVRGLLGGAACVGSPATLNAEGWPRAGGVLDFVVHGPPGGAYLVLIGSGASLTELRPYGWLFLLPPVYPMQVGVLHPVTGRVQRKLTIPALPALEGATLFEQAFAGPYLTNLMHFVVQPQLP